MPGAQVSSGSRTGVLLPEHDDGKPASRKIREAVQAYGAAIVDHDYLKRRLRKVLHGQTVQALPKPQRPVEGWNDDGKGERFASGILLHHFCRGGGSETEL